MNTKKFKILCIEDELDVKESIIEVLIDEGFDVFGADSATEGLKVFMKYKPDLIISDILMPEISGFDLLKQIRKMNSKRHNSNVPFIFLTALGNKRDLLKGVNMGANDYLIKPIDFDILIAKIKEKLCNLQTIEQGHQKDIDNLCGQISGMISETIKIEINSILKKISVLKEEHFGPLGHRNYKGVISKLHMSSQRLRALINNALDKQTVIKKVDLSEDIINPVNMTEGIIEKFRTKFNREIILELFNDCVSRLQIDSELLKTILEEILGQVIRITAENEPLRANIFIDYEKNLVFAFHGISKPKLRERNLKIELELGLKHKKVQLSPIGANLEIKIEGEDVVIMLNVPEYKIVG